MIYVKYNFLIIFFLFINILNLKEKKNIYHFLI